MKVSNLIAGGVLIAALIGGALCLSRSEGQCPDCPDGVCNPKPLPKKPAPKPQPKPEPKKPKPHCSSTDARSLAVGQVSDSRGHFPVEPFVMDEDDEEDKTSWVNGREADGEVLTDDFPGSLYMANIGSKRDGAGMCVMTSITMCARYLGLKDYYGLRDWCAKEPGGAYRQKVDDQIKRYEQAMGIKNPVPYLQYEGPDPGPVLDAIDKARLPFAHTYGWSPRYNSRIAHMVANTKFNGKFSVVLDNNPMQDFDPASNKIFEWMNKEEMIRRAKLGQNGNMWIHCWLAPPPPPCPLVD